MLFTEIIGKYCHVVVEYPHGCFTTADMQVEAIPGKVLCGDNIQIGICWQAAEIEKIDDNDEVDYLIKYSDMSISIKVLA